jgi:hypothetical protein
MLSSFTSSGQGFTSPKLTSKEISACSAYFDWSYGSSKLLIAVTLQQQKASLEPCAVGFKVKGISPQSVAGSPYGALPPGGGRRPVTPEAVVRLAAPISKRRKYSPCIELDFSLGFELRLAL